MKTWETTVIIKQRATGQIDGLTSSLTNLIVKDKIVPSQVQLQAKEKKNMFEVILTESSENIVTNNSQTSINNIVVDDNSDNSEVDSRPLNSLSDAKIEVRTQTDIKHRTVAVHTNTRCKYRSVSIRCKRP